MLSVTGLNHKIITYTKDGSFPMDNNIAERTIRKLTTQRNAITHFGSDFGAEMVVTYHSIISTVKLHSQSAWDYLGNFLKNIFNGKSDYVKMTPALIGLPVSNC